MTLNCIPSVTLIRRPRSLWHRLYACRANKKQPPDRCSHEISESLRRRLRDARRTFLRGQCKRPTASGSDRVARPSRQASLPINVDLIWLGAILGGTS